MPRLRPRRARLRRLSLRQLWHFHLPHLHVSRRHALPRMRRQIGYAVPSIVLMSAVIARATIAPLLATPSVRAEQHTQLVLGETADVLGAEGDWRHLRTHLDRYEGWMHTGYLLEADDGEVEAWRGEAQGWSLGGVMTIDGVEIRLPLRARVAPDGDAVRLPDGRRGRLTGGSVPVAPDVAGAARRMSPEQWAFRAICGCVVRMGWCDALGSRLLGTRADHLRRTGRVAAARFVAAGRVRRRGFSRGDAARRPALLPR